MSTIKIAPNAATNVTESTLKLALPRLVAFLQGISDPTIHAKLVRVGWTKDQPEEAYGFINELKAASALPMIEMANPVADAISFCEAWQSTGFVRSRTMMQVSYPAQAAFLCDGIEPAKGIGAVLNASTFIERWRVLEKGTARKETRKADLEALAILEQFGMKKAELKRLSEMVDIAQSEPDAPDPEISAEQKAAQLDVLRKMYAWVTAWSDMARTVITRRDQLIKLGIAKRRPKKARAVVTPPVPPVAAPPPPAPAPAAAPADDANGPASHAA